MIYIIELYTRNLYVLLTDVTKTSPLKTYEFFISAKFLCYNLDRSWLQVTETMESKIMNKMDYYTNK